MFFNRYLLLGFVLALLVGLNTNAMAAGSGSFRLEVPDAAAMGKGSAFVGEANSPAAVYYNPAGLTQIKKAQVSFGTAFLAPQTDFQPSGNNDKVQMRRNTFWVPHLYAAVPVISDKLTFGLGATSYFGLGTEWAQDSPLRYTATEAVIETKNYMLTGAYQLNEQWTFAVSADNDDSSVSKKKKLLQPALADGDSHLKGKDNAWGYRLATMYKVNEQHQLGLMYRSRINHKYEGKVYLDNLNNGSGVTNYQTIFGGTSYETKFTEKLTLPQSVILGYSFKPTTKWTFNFDLEWMDWSSVKHEAANWTDETNATRLAVLNVGNPAPRDWHSVWSQAIGFEYAATDRLRLRGGYYHHTSPIPQDTWEPNLPDSNSHGLTTGFGYDLSKNLTVDITYSGLMYEQRKIDNTVGNVFGANIDGQYKQYTHIGLMTLTYKF
jgi:long-chain fatty acid transport protein